MAHRKPSRLEVQALERSRGAAHGLLKYVVGRAGKRGVGKRLLTRRKSKARPEAGSLSSWYRGRAK